MPMLVSGCKGGLLKLWNPENCANIGKAIAVPYVIAIYMKYFQHAGEVSAHKSSINSIATNDTCIFSGSRYSYMYRLCHGVGLYDINLFLYIVVTRLFESGVPVLSKITKCYFYLFCYLFFSEHSGITSLLNH